MLAGVLTLRALVWLCWLVRVCACECPFVETSNSFWKEKNHLMLTHDLAGRVREWMRVGDSKIGEGGLFVHHEISSLLDA